MLHLIKREARLLSGCTFGPALELHVNAARVPCTRSWLDQNPHEQFSSPMLQGLLRHRGTPIGFAPAADR